MFFLQNDAAVAALYKTDPAAALELATEFGVTTGTTLFNEWTSFWMWLFASFRWALRLRGCFPVYCATLAMLGCVCRDGNILTPSKVPTCAPGETVNCTCKVSLGLRRSLRVDEEYVLIFGLFQAIPNSDETGYSEAWRGRVVRDSDNAVRYKVPSGDAADAARSAAKARLASGKHATRVLPPGF